MKKKKKRKRNKRNELKADRIGYLSNFVIAKFPTLRSGARSRSVDRNEPLWKDARMHVGIAGCDRICALFTRRIVSRLGRHPQDQRHHSLPQRETFTVRRSWPDPKPLRKFGLFSRETLSRHPHYATVRPDVCGGKESCRIRKDGGRSRHSAATRGTRSLLNVETISAHYEMRMKRKYEILTGYSGASTVVCAKNRTSFV